MPKSEREIEWLNGISDAERLRTLGDLEAARAITERIIEEAQLECERHPLGTADRGVCIDMLGRATHLLRTLRRARQDAPPSEE